MKLQPIAIILILLPFLIAAISYPHMPEQMASHWNAKGEADGYMSTFWGVMLMPFVILAVGLLFLFIPKIDPLKTNIGKFRAYYDGFIIIMLLFLIGVYAQTLLWNVGIQVNFMISMPLGIAVLFFYVSILCKHAKRNWFIGIRTPWTLSDEVVWKKTHEQGVIVFRAMALLCLVSVYYKSIALLLYPTLGGALYLVIYSYIVWKKRQ